MAIVEHAASRPRKKIKNLSRGDIFLYHESYYILVQGLDSMTEPTASGPPVRIGPGERFAYDLVQNRVRIHDPEDEVVLCDYKLEVWPCEGGE